ncbi:MAG: type III PLP-dependent enzyme [Pseudomonadota bacterium]
MHASKHWANPVTHLRKVKPDQPVLYFCPEALQNTVCDFVSGFPGLVTYAVKANPHSAVLANICAAGVTTFDVASPVEMALVRKQAPHAALHYNNPVRSVEEVADARKMNVCSYSVDASSELKKLNDLPKDTEVSVRLALPIEGAAYHFGDKFGACSEDAVELLKAVAELGFAPSICFHPGTQCADLEVWSRYIHASAELARFAGVRIERLNVGGGFASHRGGTAPDLAPIFEAIKNATAQAFPEDPPKLLCEPGRAIASEAFTLACRVKALRDSGAVFLNDGIYGALAEARDMEPLKRLKTVSPGGQQRRGKTILRKCFGPTCDSLDCLPEPIALPNDTEEGDYVLFSGIGAYSLSLSTNFNGYGPGAMQTVTKLA